MNWNSKVLRIGILIFVNYIHFSDNYFVKTKKVTIFNSAREFTATVKVHLPTRVLNSEEELRSINADINRIFKLSSKKYEEMEGLQPLRLMWAAVNRNILSIMEVIDTFKSIKAENRALTSTQCTLELKADPTIYNNYLERLNMSQAAMTNKNSIDPVPFSNITLTKTQTQLISEYYEMLFDHNSLTEQYLAYVSAIVAEAKDLEFKTKFSKESFSLSPDSDFSLCNEIFMGHSEIEVELVDIAHQIPEEISAMYVFHIYSKPKTVYETVAVNVGGCKVSLPFPPYMDLSEAMLYKLECKKRLCAKSSKNPCLNSINEGNMDKILQNCQVETSGSEFFFSFDTLILEKIADKQIQKLSSILNVDLKHEMLPVGLSFNGEITMINSIGQRIQFYDNQSSNVYEIIKSDRKMELCNPPYAIKLERFIMHYYPAICIAVILSIFFQFSIEILRCAKTCVLRKRKRVPYLRGLISKNFTLSPPPNTSAKVHAVRLGN